MKIESIEMPFPQDGGKFWKVGFGIPKAEKIAYEINDSTYYIFFDDGKMIEITKIPGMIITWIPGEPDRKDSGTQFVTEQHQFIAQPTTAEPIRWEENQFSLTKREGVAK